jgi:Ca2+-binding EF-hand superfamily protein
MIYNNGLNTTNQTQSRSAKQPADIQQTLSQLQSLPAFQANSSPLLQNLMQLIQTLVQQLPKDTQQSESKEKPNTRKEGGSKQNKNNQQEQHQTTVRIPEELINRDNHIIGTEGNDKLRGGSSDDYILGLGGNDRLRGLQGNDFLSGGAGSDRLYGGSGNDTLVGGQGNDYLSGGRGNNILEGGQGNDILASRLGSDYLDGGSGQDTARIRAKLDDYKISTLSQQTDPLRPIFLGSPEKTEGFVLRHKETGQVITVVNTENFHFNDVRLTSDELRSRIEDQNPPRLELSAAQNKNLQKLFGYTANSEKSIFVLDKDRNGKVSVGDEAIVFDNRADPAPGNDGIIARKILSADDVKKIKANEVSEIPLTNNQLSRIPDLFSFLGHTDEKISVIDKDGNGKISAGDIATLGSKQVIFNDATARQITTPPKGEQLKLDDTQKQQALSLFETPSSRSTTYFVDVFDSNGDGKVSKGDTAILMKSPSVIPAVEGYHNSKMEVERVSLSEAQAAQINGTKPPQQLKLTEAEHTAISNHFNRTSPDGVFDGLTVKFTGVAIDKDGNDKLSVGDVVKLHYSGGIAGFNEVRDHVLTKDDLSAIQSGQPLKLTKAEHKAIGNHFNRTPPIGTADGFSIRFTGVVLDQNNDDKLSVGDTVKLHRTAALRV